jgi:hypothetical protein
MTTPQTLPRDARGRFVKPNAEQLWEMWRENVRRRGSCKSYELEALLFERDNIRRQLDALGELHGARK